MQSKLLKNPVVLTAAMVLSIAAVLWLLVGRNGLTLTLLDGETGESYLSVPVELGDTFDVSFLHSVNKSLIIERYIVEADGIYLEECYFASYGAGVASSIDGDQMLVSLEDGRMKLSNIHRLLPNLQYRVGKVTDHLLEIGGQQYSLTELCGQNASVRFVLEQS